MSELVPNSGPTFCQICLMTFSNDQDLAMHSCDPKIKQEDQEKMESDENKVHIFKPALDMVEIKMEESESEENKPLVQNFEENDENVPLAKGKKSRKKKQSKKLLQDSLELSESASNLLEAYSDLDLSEDFLTSILKYVDDLCSIINDGDPNLERKVEVIQNLNNDVTCYRTQLEMKKQVIKKEKKEKKPKKAEKSRKKIRTSRSKKDEIDNHDPLLYEYLKHNAENNVFECSICNKNTREKRNLLRHIKLIHLDEIKSNDKSQSEAGDPMLDDSMADYSVDSPDQDQNDSIEQENELKSETEPKIEEENLEEKPNVDQKDSCEDKNCRKFYGRQKHLWCKQCTAVASVKKPPKKYKRTIPQIKPYLLCPECGKNVQNLKTHLMTVHSNEEHICQHCNLKLRSINYLKQHIRKVHDKAPCTHCGKMVGVGQMHMHVRAQHTPNDEKKYRCDVCGKGFATNQHLKEHKNIHTGEKPFKCKYCSAAFASRGTHGMHQRSHLGHHRTYSKK